jgi:hypothetical protein
MTGADSNEQEETMRKLLVGALAASAIAIAAVPASAEIWAGADEGGVGVRVGPFGAGVGPDYAWRDDYYRDCRIVRERTITPGGRVIVERHRICD